MAKVVNITSINGLVFLLNMRRKGNTIFIISLYKINRILESRKEDKEDIS
jgi:penicillin-binding protein-related factor A (putative recombinase)